MKRLEDVGSWLRAQKHFVVKAGDVTAALLVGPTRIGGVECGHFALRQPGEGWQVWVELMTTSIAQCTTAQRDAGKLGCFLVLALAAMRLLGLAFNAAADKSRTVKNNTRASVNMNTIVNVNSSGNTNVNLTRKRRAAPSFLDPLGGQTTYVVGLGALNTNRHVA